MISYRYLKTNFIVDLIATIPFRYLKLTKNPMILDLFQLLKLLRLKKLLAHLSYRALQEVIKGIFQHRIQKMVENPSKTKSET